MTKTQPGTDNPSDPEASLQILLDSGIVREEEDEVQLTEMFTTERVKSRELVGSRSIEDLPCWDNVPEEVRQCLRDLDQPMVGDAVAIKALIEPLSWSRAIEFAFSISRFEVSPRTDVAPDGFMPHQESEIKPFLQSNELSVLYFYREDSDPCATMSEHLSELAKSGVFEGMGLASIYAPACGDMPYNDYQVAAVPTVLFCLGSRPDARLVGRVARAGIKSEAALLRRSNEETNTEQRGLS